MSIKIEPVLPVLYEIDQEGFDHAMNLLHSALHPKIEFQEDLGAMRVEAREIGIKATWEAYEVFSALLTRN